MTELVVRSTLEDLVKPAAEWIGAEIVRAVAERGSCSLALAGGRTPEPVYRALASDSAIDWDMVDIYFSDERAVPPTDPDSNYGMLRRTLLTPAPIPAPRVHRMKAESSDREAAARSYELLLPQQLDILVLGIGPDGHTASLFPGAASLSERVRLVLPVIGSKPPPERMTLTPPVIEAARRIAVIATGADKAGAIARAIEGAWDPVEVPAQLARRGRWFLDRAAAERLTERRVPT